MRKGRGLQWRRRGLATLVITRTARAGRRDGDIGPGFMQHQPAALDSELKAGGLPGWRALVR